MPNSTTPFVHSSSGAASWSTAWWAQATYRALKEASYRLGAQVLDHQFGAPMYGHDVATLQARLQDLGFYTGMVDGHFGLQTHSALMAYQREYGLAADGICGPDTLRSFYFLGSRVTGGSPHAIHEEELVRRSGPKLSGKRIIIDPVAVATTAG